MSAQNDLINLYPNKLSSEELVRLEKEDKILISSFMLDKNGKPLDSNVSFYSLSKLKLYDMPVCLVKSNLVNEGFLCPIFILEQFSYGEMTNDDNYQIIIDNITIFSSPRAIDSCLKRLGENIDFNIEIENNQVEYLNFVSEKINLYGRGLKEKTLKKELYLQLFIFLSEKVRNEYDGVWYVTLQQDFKHYLYIKSKDKKFDVYSFMKTYNNNVNINAAIKAINGF